MDIKSIVSQIYDFAKNPATQQLLTNDEKMMKTLMDFTTTTHTNNDTETQLICLKAYYSLSKNIKCKENLNNTKGQLTELENLCNYNINTTNTQNIQQYAKYIIKELKKGDENTNTSKDERIYIPTYTKNKSSHAFSTRDGYISPVILTIPNLSTNTRDTLENTLLKLHGIVSFTCDTQKKTATLYLARKNDEIEERIVNSLNKVGFDNITINKTQQTKQSRVASNSPSSNDSMPSCNDKPTYIKKDTVKKDALVRYVDRRSKVDTESGWLNSVKSFFW